MIDHFTFSDLSAPGLFKSYCDHYNVVEKDNSLTLPKEIGDINIQKLLLPSDVSIIFSEFDMKVDCIIKHTVEKEQKYVLWISLLELESNIIIWNKDEMTASKEIQPVAFLLNSLFEFTQFRKKNTKGKSILIFIPPYLLKSFGKEKTKEDLLGKYYALQNQNFSLLKLSEIEIEKAMNVFKQWRNHKNIIGISKSIFQLLEWYFRIFNDFIKDDSKKHRLSEQQAFDLYALQNFVKSNLSLPKLDFETFEKSIVTPMPKLKKLFQAMHNKSIYDYITIEKMNAAKELLIKTIKTIAEIAYEFGYANPSNFSTAFKKVFNEMPNEYRKNLKKESD